MNTTLTTHNEDLQEVLNFDGLHEAGKITGKSYKNDSKTESLGFALIMLNSQIKQEILEKSGDSNKRTTIPEMISYMVDLGFVELYNKTIDFIDYGEPEKVTQYYYYNYEKYVLCVFESYPDYRNEGQYVINSAKMHYAVKAPWENLKGTLSSGGYDSDNGVWNGDHDIREGFKFKFNNLDKAGVFVPWTGNAFLWLCTYAETRGEHDYKEINEEVLSHFPDDVKQNMMWYK